jgi:hypothetical protein
MSADEAGRKAASTEGVLAAVVLAVVSMLLLATLRCDGAGITPASGAGSVASRPADRP